MSQPETDSFSPVFSELSQKFVEFADVLTEVSERTSSTSNLDLLRLYERWLTTGSSRSGRMLVKRGVVPEHQPPKSQSAVGDGSGRSSLVGGLPTFEVQIRTPRQFSDISVVPHSGQIFGQQRNEWVEPI